MKPATAKAKGRMVENEYVGIVADYIGLKVERRRLAGTNDKGDIAGFADLCVEVKSGGGKLLIPEWLRQLETERINAGASIGQLAVRPRGGTSSSDWWAIRPLIDDLDLLQSAGHL